MSKPTYLNDHWTLADGLGFGATAEQLARVALQAQPPFTVALTGKWGAGKTSVLRQAFATLGGEPIAQALPIGEPLSDGSFNQDMRQMWKQLSYFRTKSGDKSKLTEERLELGNLAERCLCVWYSPWQHQQANNPLLPLLLEIKNQYSAWAKFTGKLHEVNERGGWAGLALIERVIDATATIFVGKQIKLASGTSAEVAKAWRDAAPNLEQISDGQRFHLLFEGAIETLLQSSPKKVDSKSQGLKDDARLIIFIDDLDRCEESVIVQLLESIKLYLHSQRCVFILGIDPDAVLGALARHWPQRSEQSNAEYLEKLVQAQLEVPQPVLGDIKKVIREHLDKHGIPEDKPQQPEIQIGDLVDMLEKLLEPNPRKIKNFLNSLSAHWHLLPKTTRVPKNTHLFALFHYLRIYHRPVWRLLSHQSWTLELLCQVLTKPNASLGLVQGADEAILSEEQAIAREMLVRAFFHVLSDDNVYDLTPNEPYHGSIPLAQAVQSFINRLDRKRSDQYFVNCLRQLISPAKASEAEILLKQMSKGNKQ